MTDRYYEFMNGLSHALLSAPPVFTADTLALHCREHGLDVHRGDHVVQLLINKRAIERCDGGYRIHPDLLTASLVAATNEPTPPLPKRRNFQ